MARPKKIDSKENPLQIKDLESLKSLKGSHWVTYICKSCSKTVLVNFRRERLNRFEKLLCTDCQTKSTCMEVYGTEYAHQNKDIIEKTKATNKERYGSECVFSNDEIKEKIKETNLRKYGETSYTKTQEYLKKSKETCQRKYGKDFYTQTKEYLEKEKATNQKKLGVDFSSQHPEVQRRVKQTFIDHFGSDNYYHQVRYEYDSLKFDSSWELYFYIYNKSLGYDVVREPCSFDYYYNGKEHKYFPDFMVNGVLYELKGDQFFENGKMINPFDRNMDDLFEAKHQCGLRNGVKFYKNTEMETIINYVDSKYTKDYVSLFKVDAPFPYPNQDLSDESDMGLIRHFHKSLYEASIKSRPSPLRAWGDKKLVQRCAKNRLEYIGRCKPSDILQGFNVTKIAGKVSVFKPQLAEQLIKRYINDSDIIYDPFSGFSGRMLGAFNCGKQYFGFDINEDHVRESNEIIDYKKIGDMCEVKVQDLITTSPKDYTYLRGTALFTCPPYGGKEHWNENNDEIEKTCDEWISICLEKYKCKKYLFVVDVTEKYKDFIVEELDSPSLWGKKKEKVILIEDKNGIL